MTEVDADLMMRCLDAMEIAQSTFVALTGTAEDIANAGSLGVARQLGREQQRLLAKADERILAAMQPPVPEEPTE